MFTRAKWIGCVVFFTTMFVFSALYPVHPETIGVKELDMTKLIQKLADESTSSKAVRELEEWLLEHPLDKHAAVLTPLISNLHHSDNEELRGNCALIIASSKSEKAVDALAWALQNDKARVNRELAAVYLGIMARGAKTVPSFMQTIVRVIPALEMAIKSDTGMNEDGSMDIEGSDIAQMAVLALGEIGKPAVPTLLRVWKDQSMHEGCKRSLVFALGCTRDKRAIGVLTSMLEGTDQTFRERAAWVLGEFGTKEVLPVLMRYQGDPDERVRQNVVEAIKKLKGELKKLSE